MKDIIYYIEFDKGYDCYVLYSKVSTNFGGDAINYIASSIHKGYLEDLKRDLEENS